MAIVVYKCDVCKREKEYIRNVEGIEKVQRCTITHGCRGKLFHVENLQDYTRASAPNPVLGLDEWRQRKVLYNHTQTIARDEWIIKHNLGTFPSISIFVNIPIEDDPENLEEIQPVDTIIVDENNMILTFNRSWSGIAQLVARQSDPNLLKPFTRVVEVVEDELQQISLKGDIAIATRISSLGECPEISLNIQYTNTQNVVIPVTNVATVNDDDTDSPWRDFGRVVIKGKLFIVRTFNEIFNTTANDIGSGSTFKIIETLSQSDFPSCTVSSTQIPIEKDDVYILFANEPYDTVDKNITSYVDVADITDTENQFALLFDNNEFFVKKAAIQTTYPPIRVVL